MIAGTDELVILRVTAPSIPAGQIPAAFAPIAIGLTLLIIHLFAIPVDNASVNPARSTGTAVYVGGWALKQLWLFWVAPLLGAGLGGLLHRWLARQEAPP
jgi:aquaporin Z